MYAQHSRILTDEARAIRNSANGRVNRTDSNNLQIAHERIRVPIPHHVKMRVDSTDVDPLIRVNELVVRDATALEIGICRLSVMPDWRDGIVCACQRTLEEERRLFG